MNAADDGKAEVWSDTEFATGIAVQAGTLVLNGSANSAGKAVVSGGGLIVGGSAGQSSATLAAAGGVNVGAGGLLGGHGTITGDVVVGGILSPGNSIGTTTVNGDLTLLSGGFLDVEADPDQPGDFSSGAPGVGDRTVVTGTANLAGTLRHVTRETAGTAEDYAVSGKEWLILDAGTGLVGAFEDAESDLAFLFPQLRYDRSAFDVWLSFVRGLPFGEYASTYNQRATAAGLESLDRNSGLYRELLGATTRDQARATLDGLSGEIHATLKGGLFLLDASFLRSLARHVSLTATAREKTRGEELASPSDERRLLTANNLWITVEGSHTTMGGDGNAGRAVAYGPEVSFGYDADFVNGWLGGMAFRYSAKRMDVDGRDSEADVDSYTAALYGGKQFPLGPGTLRLLLAAEISGHDVSVERKARIGTRAQNLEADYDGDSFLGSLEAAYALPLSEQLTLEAFASVGWHSLRLDGFAENGGNAALRRKEERWSHALSTVGLRASFQAHERLTLNAEAGWRHTYGGDVPKTDLAFREGSDRFTVKGVTLNRDEALVGLGLGLRLTDNVRLGLDYKGGLGNRAQSHGGSATVEVTW
jgi:outer membrane autotransporter protein